MFFRFSALAIFFITSNIYAKTQIQPTQVTCLNSPGDWELLREKPDGNFKLCRNIDFKNQNLTPIPMFTGTLNGKGKRLINVRLFWLEGSQIALFSVNRGTLKNLRIVNSNVTGSHLTATLVARNEGRVKNVQVLGGAVTGVGNTTGGLIGWNRSMGTVTHSRFDGQVVGQNTTGGLVGSSDGLISGSSTSGSVFGSINVGGFLGAKLGDKRVADSTANMDVVGTSKVGGFVGNASSLGFPSSIDFLNCRSFDSTIEGQTITGGFAGFLQEVELSDSTTNNQIINVFGNDSFGCFQGALDGSVILNQSFHETGECGL